MTVLYDVSSILAPYICPSVDELGCYGISARASRVRVDVRDLSQQDMRVFLRQPALDTGCPSRLRTHTLVV